MAILQFPRNSPQPSPPIEGAGGPQSGNSEKRQRPPHALESVKIDLDEDEIRRLIDALDHYEAYLHSQQRDDAKFRELLVRLRKMLGKRP
jgi:hypothetical protein